MKVFVVVAAASLVLAGCSKTVQPSPTQPFEPGTWSGTFNTAGKYTQHSQGSISFLFSKETYTYSGTFERVISDTVVVKGSLDWAGQYKVSGRLVDLEDRIDPRLNAKMVVPVHFQGSYNYSWDGGTLVISKEDSLGSEIYSLRKMSTGL